MAAALDDLTALDHEDLVGGADRGRRWAITKVVRLARRRCSPSWIIASLSLSRLEVASSRMRIFGRASSARDRDALALAAGELDAALAHHGLVALLEGLHEFVAVRHATTSSISARDALGREKPMFSAIVPSKRKLSWRTTPRCER